MDRDGRRRRGLAPPLSASRARRVRRAPRTFRRKRRGAGPSDCPADGPSPIEEAIGTEALERYEAALRRLRPVDRQAIVARIELGLPYTEIARTLRKPTIAFSRLRSSPEKNLASDSQLLMQMLPTNPSQTTTST